MQVFLFWKNTGRSSKEKRFQDFRTFMGAVVQEWAPSWSCCCTALKIKTLSSSASSLLLLLRNSLSLSLSLSLSPSDQILFKKNRVLSLSSIKLQTLYYRALLAWESIYSRTRERVLQAAATGWWLLGVTLCLLAAEVAFCFTIAAKVSHGSSEGMGWLCNWSGESSKLLGIFLQFWITP
jgi:hypothetical protein